MKLFQSAVVPLFGSFIHVVTGTSYPTYFPTYIEEELTPPQQQLISILHIGDSYSSGNGFDVDESGWYGPKWCFRNHNSWGEQAVRIVNAGIPTVDISYHNHACCDAKIEHITQDKVTIAKCGHNDGDSDPQYTRKYAGWSFLDGRTCEHRMDPQIDNVNESIDIVLLTIGGNDSGFVEIIKSCFIPFLSVFGQNDCEEVIDRARGYVHGYYESELINVVTMITSRMKAGSKLILHAYPLIATDRETEDNILVRGITQAAIEVQIKAIEYLNSLGREVDIILFTDHVNEFENHNAETCSSCYNPNGWLNEISESGISLEKDELAQLYHPNEEGHKNWAISFADKLGSIVYEMIEVSEPSNSTLI